MNLTPTMIEEIRERAEKATNERTELNVPNPIAKRLRGIYGNGPALPNGQPEFGWRDFVSEAFQPTRVQLEAADLIESFCTDIPALLAHIAFLEAEKKTAVEAEREACVEIAEGHLTSYSDGGEIYIVRRVVASIRSRSLPDVKAE